MTWIVVLGPYPPSADPAADLVLAAVRAFRPDTVVVVSPVRSAASVTADPTRWAGAWRVARMVRTADRVVWFAPSDARPAFPLRGALRPGRKVERRTIDRPHGTPQRTVADRLRRARAGAPTLARTFMARTVMARTVMARRRSST